MARRTWHIDGEYVEYCSCDHGCPCEAMAPPTQGHCEGAVAFRIADGQCDGVDLSGLIVAATFFFPRAIHHGGGHMQPFLESHTTQAQRDALFYILSGEDQPVGTIFQIFSVIVETHHDPVFTELTFEWDVARRRARVAAHRQFEAESRPIRNPVTDEEHRVLTTLPQGWVFREAENAAGFARSLGSLKYDLSDRHSSLAYIHWNQDGMASSLQDERARRPLA